MSQVVDTKVVEMQFDNSKFEKNIEVSLNSLKFLNKNIDDAGKNRGSLDELARAGDQVGISFDNMNLKSRISLNMFDMLAGIGTKAFNRISDAVAGFALNMANSLSGMQAMRDGFNEYELKMGSVQTMLVGAKIIDPDTLKTTKDETRRLEIINDELEKLNEYSDKTIYSFKDMTSNIGKFTNNGVELHDAVDAIQGVANVAAAAGANSSEASRAMYNFSQALSSGAVKLIDWKSIENANMATQDFKQQLLDTALVMGTVTKSGKEYKSTTTDLQGKISDAFTKTKGFNDSLAHQWMTTEVLTQTLKNYSTDVRYMTDHELQEYKDGLIEIGYTSKQVERIIENSRKAFEAATEVKTFTQMIDTLKESLGSGWAQTFEIIIGDFNEAKKLFTGLNNAIDNILSPIGKARNAILKTWKADGGRTAMIDSFKNLYYAVLNLFEPIKKLWKAFTPNTEHTGKALATIFKWIEKLTELIRKGADIVGRSLSVLLKPVIAFGIFVGKMLISFVGLIRNVFGRIKTFLEPAATAIKTFSETFTTAFDTKVTSKIKAFKSTLKTTIDDIKKRLKESKAIEGISNAFKELRTVIHDLFGSVVSHAIFYAKRFAKYLREIWNAITPIISSAFTAVIKKISSFILPKLEKAITFVTKKIKAFATALNKIDIKNTKFYKELAKLPDRIKEISTSKLATGIKSFATEAVAFLTEKFEKLKSVIESIKSPSGLKNLFEDIKNFIKSVFGKGSIADDAGSKLTEGLPGEKEGKELTTFQKFLDGVSTAFEWFTKAVDKARNALKDFVDFIIKNTPKALKSFHDFLAGEDGVITISDITDAIYLVSHSFSELLFNSGFDKLGTAAKNFSESMSELTGAVITFAKRAGNKFNMSALKDFAIAMGILVASMWVLSKIPTDKLLVAAGVLGTLGVVLVKFFGQISSASADLSKTVGFLPIAVMLLSIAAAVVMVTASFGMLIGALAAFPSIIKQYKGLGKDFKTGMDRVKVVLEQIFEYLDHAAGSKYSFRSAMALLGLVAALGLIRKTIVKFANKKTGESMEEGLSRIKQVLDTLGTFLESVQLASMSIINVGIDLDAVGMAGMILALAYMIDKITPSIEKLAQLKENEFDTAFKALRKILFYFGAFLTEAALISFFTDTGLGQWLGISATITLLAGAISSCVSSVKTLAGLASGNPDGLSSALGALTMIFIELGAVLFVIGKMKPEKAPLFALSVAIGVLTGCVVALEPLAARHPEALRASVLSIGGLMLALGGTLYIIGKASEKAGTSMGDVVKLIGVSLSMMILVDAIRRLSKTGGKASNILASSTAIGLAALAIAGAMKLLSTAAAIPPTVLIGLFLLTAAIWGVAIAIMAFKQSSGEMVSGANNVSKGSDEMAASVGNMATTLQSSGVLDTIKDLLVNAFKDIGKNIGDAISNFDLGKTIRGMIEDVKADAKNWAQDAIDLGTGLIDGVSTAISDPGNVEKIKNSIIGLGKALLESFKLFFGINSPSKVMADQGGFIIDGLVQGLMNFPGKIAEWVAGIGGGIVDGIKGLVSGAADKGRALVNGIGEGIQNGKDLVKKAASKVGSVAVKAAGKAKEWGKQAVKSAEAFGSKLTSSRNPIKRAAGHMILGAVNHVKTTGAIFKAAASSAATKFVSEIRKGTNPAKAAAKAIVAGAKSAFNNIGTAFKTFGTNAAEGFRNGINNMVSKIAEKAKEMVRKAKEAAKKEQNSNSPSKDFMEYGGWAAQGYALGMINRKNTRLVETNAKKMVDVAKRATMDNAFINPLYVDSNPAVGSLAYAMGLIADTLDSGIDSSPMIRPVIDMSDVTRGASAISALFGREHIGASLNVTESIQNDFARTMAKKNDALSTQSIDKLASRINDMTNTMNARSMNNYINVDGTADPEAFADGLLRSFRLNARMV